MINIVMGKPGAGKTTYAAVIAKKALKKKKNVWSNVEIKGTKKLDIEKDIKYLYDGIVIIDEAGLVHNNRNWKKFTDELYKFYAMHRHYKLEIYLFVQYWDRLDIVIRELVQRIYVVKPTLLRSLYICVREIGCCIDINEKGEIIEKFYWKNIIGGLRYYLHINARKLFKTYEEKRDSKDWEVWK